MGQACTSQSTTGAADAEKKQKRKSSTKTDMTSDTTTGGEELLHREGGDGASVSNSDSEGDSSRSTKQQQLKRKKKRAKDCVLAPKRDQYTLESYRTILAEERAIGVFDEIDHDREMRLARQISVISRSAPATPVSPQSPLVPTIQGAEEEEEEQKLDFTSHTEHRNMVRSQQQDNNSNGSGSCSRSGADSSRRNTAAGNHNTATTNTSSKYLKLDRLVADEEVGATAVDSEDLTTDDDADEYDSPLHSRSKNNGTDEYDDSDDKKSSASTASCGGGKEDPPLSSLSSFVDEPRSPTRSILKGKGSTRGVVPTGGMNSSSRQYPQILAGSISSSAQSSTSGTPTAVSQSASPKNHPIIISARKQQQHGAMLDSLNVSAEFSLFSPPTPPTTLTTTSHSSLGGATASSLGLRALQPPPLKSVIRAESIKEELRKNTTTTDHHPSSAQDYWGNGRDNNSCDQPPSLPHTPVEGRGGSEGQDHHCGHFADVLECSLNVSQRSAGASSSAGGGGVLSRSVSFHSTVVSEGSGLAKRTVKPSKLKD